MKTVTRTTLEDTLYYQKRYKIIKNGVNLYHAHGKPLLADKKDKKSFTKDIRNSKGYADHLKKKHGNRKV